MASARVRALLALARAKAASSVKLADPVADEARVLTALTEWFASKDAISAAQLPGELLDQLVDIGIARRAAAKAAEWLLAQPLTGRSRYGAPTSFDGMPLSRRVATEEPAMRAAYLLAAARRLTEALGKDRYPAGLDAERGYLDQHVAAGRNRRAGALKVDELGKDGQVLVWRTAGDDRVEATCRALEGRLFTADNPPAIPGAVHPRCRCTAEPWGKGPFLDWGRR